MQLISPYTKSLDAVQVLFSMSLKYLLFTSTFYLFFYVWKKKRYWYSKIQQKYPDKKQIIREVKYSFFTILIFGAVIMLVIWCSKMGLTRVYEPVDKYGYGYYILSILIMVAIHDTYFYWTHRAMHWKPLFKRVHKIHHLSLDPTPFAAYAFHPLEAIIEIGIIPLIAFTIPYHRSALTIFSLYSLLLNVAGHLGYELFPKGFASHRLLKWHNTSTHHNMHHRLVKCNYGLYFNFWDRVMGTNHPHYEESYDKVIEQREQGKLVLEKAKNSTPVNLSFAETDKA
jgi:lathosterol oxidase